MNTLTGEAEIGSSEKTTFIDGVKPKKKNLNVKMLNSAAEGFLNSHDCVFLCCTTNCCVAVNGNPAV